MVLHVLHVPTVDMYSPASVLSSVMDAQKAAAKNNNYAFPTVRNQLPQVAKKKPPSKPKDGKVDKEAMEKEG